MEAESRLPWTRLVPQRKLCSGDSYTYPFTSTAEDDNEAAAADEDESDNAWSDDSDDESDVSDEEVWKMMEKWIDLLISAFLWAISLTDTHF